MIWIIIIRRFYRTLSSPPPAKSISPSPTPTHPDYLPSFLSRESFDRRQLETSEYTTRTATASTSLVNNVTTWIGSKFWSSIAAAFNLAPYPESSTTLTGDVVGDGHQEMKQLRARRKAERVAREKRLGSTSAGGGEQRRGSSQFLVPDESLEMMIEERDDADEDEEDEDEDDRIYTSMNLDDPIFTRMASSSSHIDRRTTMRKERNLRLSSMSNGGSQVEAGEEERVEEHRTEAQEYANSVKQLKEVPRVSILPPDISLYPEETQEYGRREQSATSLSTASSHGSALVYVRMSDGRLVRKLSTIESASEGDCS